MCGIAGTWTKDGVTSTGLEGGLEAAMERIGHRGPDARGIFSENRLHVGHLRLSILDLSEAASQPMQSGRHLLAYNGEVYNFAELREELVAMGEVFRSSGDTEVVLAACARFGVAEACRKFNGMFALAFFDREEGVLWLARDRFGIKPLYFFPEPGGLAFASELKCFGRAAQDGSLPDAAVVMAMLSGAPNLGPGTPWAGVKEVEPGAVVRFAVNDSFAGEVTRFFQLEDAVDEAFYREIASGGQREYENRFDDVFSRAVASHLASDVPVGVGLSGGIDSTAVLAAARAAGATPRAFHAEVSGFESERLFAEAAAEACETPLAVATMNRGDFARLLPELTWHNDYPLAYHTNSVPFAMMARRASQDDVKVLLTGEGADELLGGYGWIYDDLRERRIARRGDVAARVLNRLRLGGLGTKLRRFTAGGGGGQGRDFLRLRDLWNGHQTSRWQEAAARAYAFLPQSEERTFAEDFFVTAHGHLQSLLWRNDRMGMLAGIESRFPFLDNELVRLLVNTPMEFKCRRGVRKAPLREAALRLGVPRKIAARPKFAFSANPSFFCPLQSSFFRQGFLEHYLPSITREEPLADWDHFYFYLVATEVWGRLFVFGHRPEAIYEDLLRHRLPG